MATTLPTRIRINIRDDIESENSTLSSKFAALSKTIGYPVKFDPEWPLLWEELKEWYPDNSTFIPSIVAVLTCWCEAFEMWLEAQEEKSGDKEDGEVDRLMEEMKGIVKIELEVAKDKSKRPKQSWIRLRNAFVIALPKTEPSTDSLILSGFLDDFTHLFKPDLSKPDSILISTPNTTTGAEDPEAWDDLEIPIQATKASSPTPNPSKFNHISFQERIGEDLAPESLPNVTAIPRPDELIRKPPYWLVVRQESRDRVVVHASHAGSLTCLEEYLKKWCRGDGNYVGRPPVVEIKSLVSAFGPGVVNDTIVIEGIRGREVSAVLVLVFVENVLGYVSLESRGQGGSVWVFKRWRAFK